MWSFLKRFCLLLAFGLAAAACYAQSEASLHKLASYLGTAKADDTKLAIVKFGAKAIPVMEDFASKGESKARVDATGLLAEVGTYSEFTFLIGLIIDRDEKVREPASDAIDELRKQEWRRILSPLAKPGGKIGVQDNAEWEEFWGCHTVTAIMP